MTFHVDRHPGPGRGGAIGGASPRRARRPRPGLRRSERPARAMRRAAERCRSRPAWLGPRPRHGRDRPAARPATAGRSPDPGRWPATSVLVRRPRRPAPSRSAAEPSVDHDVGTGGSCGGSPIPAWSRAVARSETMICQDTTSITRWWAISSSRSGVPGSSSARKTGPAARSRAAWPSAATDGEVSPGRMDGQLWLVRCRVGNGAPLPVVQDEPQSQRVMGDDDRRQRRSQSLDRDRRLEGEQHGLGCRVRGARPSKPSCHCWIGVSGTPPPGSSSTGGVRDRSDGREARPPGFRRSGGRTGRPG